MNIVICGSMAFAKEMINAKTLLEKKGHSVDLPGNAQHYADGSKCVETKWEKLEHDVIKVHYEKIKRADAILVLNHDKKGIKNYVGGNSLIEIAFAHVHNKKIFLLNPAPDLSYKDEIEAMRPIVLNGNISSI